MILLAKILFRIIVFYTCQRGFIHIPKVWKAASVVAIRAAWTASIVVWTAASFDGGRRARLTGGKGFFLSGRREGEREKRGWREGCSRGRGWLPAGYSNPIADRERGKMREEGDCCNLDPGMTAVRYAHV